MAAQKLEVNQEALLLYLRTRYWIAAVLALPMWGAGLVMMLAYLWAKNTYWPRYFEQLNYELTEENLVVSKGVYFRRQVTIPLWKVTDVLVLEGPLQRHCGIKSLRVQTAGRGHAMAEGALLGLADPEAARQLILDRMAQVKRASE